MNAIYLYFKFVAVSFRAQLVYRASFLLSMLSNALATWVDLVAIYAFFLRFGRVGEWTMAEVALFYGMINMAFALSEGYMRGFDIFDRHVRTGDFDRILVRPRSTFLQVMGSHFQLRRGGRFLVGAFAAFWGMQALALSWSGAQWALFGLSILGGSLLFSGIILLRAMTCFWTIESLEVFNAATFGGVETGQYPMDIYVGWIRKFFTRIVPLAAINYWPLSELLGRHYVPAPLAWLSPAIGALLFALGYLCWRIGERKYRSVGS